MIYNVVFTVQCFLILVEEWHFHFNRFRVSKYLYSFNVYIVSNKVNLKLVCIGQLCNPGLVVIQKGIFKLIRCSLLKSCRLGNSFISSRPYDMASLSQSGFVSWPLISNALIMHIKPFMPNTLSGPVDALIEKRRNGFQQIC